MHKITILIAALTASSIVLSMENDNQSKMQKWLEHSGDNYFAHAVNPQNIKSIIEDGKLKPAELLLREKKTVEFESSTWSQGRERFTVKQSQIKI